MPTTPAQAAPYPAPAAIPDVPADIQALAVWADTKVVMKFASAAARNAAIPAPTSGMFAWLDDLDVWTHYNGSAWVNWVGLDQFLAAPLGQVSNDVTARTASAPTTTGVNLIPSVNVTHPGGPWTGTTRRMNARAAGRGLGTTGGETGRAFWLIDGGGGRSTQIQPTSAGAAGEVGWELDVNFTLTTGQTRTVRLDILRVAGGSSITFSVQDFTIRDEGAQF